MALTDMEYHWQELARSAEAAREIGNRTLPEGGMEAWQMASWYAEQLGELKWHADVLAGEIERQLADRKRLS